jgi:hypothetical protein
LSLIVISLPSKFFIYINRLIFKRVFLNILSLIETKKAGTYT